MRPSTPSISLLVARYLLPDPTNSRYDYKVVAGHRASPQRPLEPRSRIRRRPVPGYPEPAVREPRKPLHGVHGALYEVLEVDFLHEHPDLGVGQAAQPARLLVAEGDRPEGDPHQLVDGEAGLGQHAPHDVL